MGEKLLLTADHTKRIYCDISKDTEQKIRLRYIQLELKTGEKFNRRKYLEYIIEQDIAHVNGAARAIVADKRQNTKGV